MTITLPAVRKKQRSVLVVDRKMNKVVTAIEVLSPSNKASGNDRTAYLSKRGEYFGNGISLVEIDFLRAGTRLPLGNPPPVVEDYYTMVCRGWEFPRADLWAFAVRDPLPAVPIPLAEGVPETILPLRECVDRAYLEGSYDTEVDYESRLDPPLRKATAAWAKELLASRINLTS